MLPVPRIVVGPPYTSVQDALNDLERLETALLQLRDRRGVFVTAYRLITGTLDQWIRQGRFHDNAWVTRYVVSFANLYREALEKQLAGHIAQAPAAWQISLETSAAGLALVIQDLILGINAHINRDLPFALDQVGIDGATRYADHTLVNKALRDATGVVQDRIAEYYASGLGILGTLLGNFDEELTGFSFENAREHAWRSGVALVAAQGNPQRDQIEALVESQAKLLARTILLPNTRLPWLIVALRQIEQMKPWFEPVFERFETRLLMANAAEGIVADIAGVSETFAAPCPPPVTTLDEVIVRLTEMTARWDAQRNRLSIYATVYRRITQKVKALAEGGGFQDPGWMVRVDILFANRYFDIICQYEAGRLDEIPGCWAVALDTVRSGRTMIAQDIAVQIAPRVIFDLPSIIFEAGLADNLAARKADYEKTYELFIEELDCIQEMIARKYSQLVTFMDFLAGRLDETISNVLYTRARTEAWEDGIALRDAGSQAERDRIVRSHNRKAVQSINEVLFYNLPPFSWMVSAVRQAEELFGGDWSSTVDDCE